MSPTLRTLLASVLIASVAPLGAAILDLEQPAFAKGNGGGNGGGHGGGNGGGHGNSGGNGHGNSGTHSSHAKTVDTADVDESTDEGTVDEEDDSLAPSALGKLNGVLHASPNAIAHANVNSPIGTARAFGEALGSFLGDEATTEEEGEGDEEAVTVEQLGAMMANMTNKPVTAAQVQAVADKVLPDEEADEATGDEATGDEAAGDETTDEDTAEDDTGEGEDAPKLDQATAEAIAEEANKIHGFTTDEDDTADDGTGDDTADEDTTDDDTDETADSGETPEDEVPTN